MSANTVVVLIVGFLLALVMLLPLLGQPSAMSRVGADAQLLGISTPPPVLALTPQPDETD